METLNAPARRKDVSPAELRQLIKQETGYNARQVTVSQGSSSRWITVTVRDASVDLKAVRIFADQFDTMECGQDDSYRGQSVDVKTTGQVDAAHAAPFVAEIKAAISRIIATGETVKLSTGTILHKETERGGDFYVTRFETGTRGCYIRGYDVTLGEAWTVTALALQASRV